MRKHLLVVPKCRTGLLSKEYYVKFFGNKDDAEEYAFVCKLAGYCVDILGLDEYNLSRVYKHRELEFEL